MNFDYGNQKAKGYHGYFLSHCSGYSRRNVRVAAGFAHQSRSFFHDPRLYFIFLLYGAGHNTVTAHKTIPSLCLAILQKQENMTLPHTSLYWVDERAFPHYYPRTPVLESNLCISNSRTCEFGEIRTKSIYFLGQVCGGGILAALNKWGQNAILKPGMGLARRGRLFELSNLRKCDHWVNCIRFIRICTRAVNFRIDVQ